jgi:hypothetical protein
MIRSQAPGVLRVVSAVAVTALLAGAVGAQSARPAATLDDLLAETRSLRTDMREAVTVAIRAQVLATRLSLQEQRIRTAAAQVAESRRTLAATASERRARVTHLAELQNLRRAGNLPAGQIGELDEMLLRLREDVERWTSDEQAQMDDEQELRRTLSSEENLWRDFSSRLEELERSLPVPGRR